MNENLKECIESIEININLIEDVVNSINKTPIKDMPVMIAVCNETISHIKEVLSDVNKYWFDDCK